MKKIGCLKINSNVVDVYLPKNIKVISCLNTSDEGHFSEISLFYEYDEMDIEEEMKTFEVIDEYINYPNSIFIGTVFRKQYSDFRHVYLRKYYEG